MKRTHRYLPFLMGLSIAGALLLGACGGTAPAAAPGSQPQEHTISRHRPGRVLR